MGQFKQIIAIYWGQLLILLALASMLFYFLLWALKKYRLRAEALKIRPSIILPVGNSKLALKAAQSAFEMSTALGAKVVLVYVETAPADSPATSEGHAILKGETELLKSQQVRHIETEIRYGEFGQEIANCAVERNALMIILAGHHVSPIGSLLMGDRTYSLFKNSTVPILRIVR